MKPMIFVSHISQEAELALQLKVRIERDFLGMVELFISSDGESIAAGSKWLQGVEEALQKAQLEIVLCSKQSVNRPWINFEAGAGWIKQIPIVPVCHTDLTPSELPVPLSMLQAVAVDDPTGLERLYRLISESVGCTKPAIDFVQFARELTETTKTSRAPTQKPKRLLASLLVQVTVSYLDQPDRNRYATGVVVAPGAVLTAAHLLEDESAVFAVSKDGYTWHDTEVVWNGMPDQWDAMILKTSEPLVNSAPSLSEIVLADEPHSHAWYGASYAEAGKTASGREAVPMSGTTCPIASDGADFYVDVQTGPSDVKQWKGVSGGPIIVDNHLAGIVSRTNRVFDGKRLRVVPMWRLVQVSEFKDAVESEG